MLWWGGGMKWFLLLLPFIFASCSLTATVMPVSGPNAAHTAPLTAKFTYIGSGHGKAEITMPWGEVCKGTYSTVVGGSYHPGFDAESKPSVVAVSSSSSAGIYGIQTGRALLFGNQGTHIEVEYTTSGANPRHGFGSAKDSRGNIYKVIW
jgi:hypothetical protein